MITFSSTMLPNTLSSINAFLNSESKISSKEDAIDETTFKYRQRIVLKICLLSNERLWPSKLLDCEVDVPALADVNSEALRK